MLNIGDKVPELSAQAYHQGKIVKVNFGKKASKWLVLLFYPADFTFVCPTELEEAARLDPQFKKASAQIMSVSTDSVYVHKAWHDSSKAIGKIKYPMLADPTGEISRAFGTYIEQEGVSMRATFIINPQGVVKALEKHDNSIGRNMEEILRKLQASVYVSNAVGEVCPVNWKPGKKTLKPGLDLVGKI